MDATHVVMTVMMLSMMPVALGARWVGMALNAKFARTGDEENGE